MVTDEEERRQAESRTRAQAEGVIWLNDVFRFQKNRKRLFGRRGPRLNKLEVAWMVISAILVALILFGGFSALGIDMASVPPFLFFFHPIAIAFWALIAGWNGRRIANMSPLRRHTGEETGVWLAIMFKRMVVRISFLFDQPTMYNKVITHATKGGEPMEVEAIEWIGTARSPRAPVVAEPNADPELITTVPVIMPPRGVRTVLPRRRSNFLSR